MKAGSQHWGLLLLLPLLALTGLAPPGWAGGEAGTPAASACGRWMRLSVGTPPPGAQVTAQLLLGTALAPPNHLCPLRALYVASQLDPENAERYLDRGEARALALLSGQGGWEGLTAPKAAKRAGRAGPTQLPALFWVGYFWIHRLAHASRFRAAMEVGNAVAILGQISARAPELYAGAADATLGGYYAELPRFFGRDRKRARAHFERSLAHYQGNLARRWTHARSYLRASDPDAYGRAIEAIASSPLDPDAPYYLESYFTRADARELIEEWRAAGTAGASPER